MHIPILIIQCFITAVQCPKYIVHLNNINYKKVIHAEEHGDYPVGIYYYRSIAYYIIDNNHEITENAFIVLLLGVGT